MELERDGSLPFLDTLLTRREDGTINTSVYRKPTHTDRYLQYTSHHPGYVKRGVVSCLFHRARTVAAGEEVSREEEHLCEVLRSNGYPEHVFRSAALQRERRQEETTKYTICLPYVSGVSEDLRRVCRRFDIRSVFTTVSTLRKHLTRVKDRDPLLRKSGVVYNIPCSSCSMQYIGETRRALETRLKEHQAATRRGELERSALAEHAWTEHHLPAWDEVAVLEEARNDKMLRIKEALCIALAEQQQLLNRDRGTPIADCWGSLLQRMRVTNRQRRAPQDQSADS